MILMEPVAGRAGCACLDTHVSGRDTALRQASKTFKIECHGFGVLDKAVLFLLSASWVRRQRILIDREWFCQSCEHTGTRTGPVNCSSTSATTDWIERNVVDGGPDRSVTVQVSVVAQPGLSEPKFAIECFPGLCLTLSPGGTQCGSRNLSSHSERPERPQYRSPRQSREAQPRSAALG